MPICVCARRTVEQAAPTWAAETYPISKKPFIPTGTVRTATKVTFQRMRSSSFSCGYTTQRLTWVTPRTLCPCLSLDPINGGEGGAPRAV